MESIAFASSLITRSPSIPMTRVRKSRRRARRWCRPESAKHPFGPPLSRLNAQESGHVAWMLTNVVEQKGPMGMARMRKPSLRALTSIWRVGDSFRLLDFSATETAVPVSGSASGATSSKNSSEVSGTSTIAAFCTDGFFGRFEDLESFLERVVKDRGFPDSVAFPISETLSRDEF